MIGVGVGCGRGVWPGLTAFGLVVSLVTFGCGGGSTGPAADGREAVDGAAPDDTAVDSAPVALEISVGSRDFGSVVVGTQSAPFVFTVTNSGTAVSGVAVATAASADFAMGSNGCNAAIPAGQSCKVEMIFKPASAGAKAGTLTVAAGAAGSVSAALLGTGLIAGALSIAPGDRDFLAVAVGDMSIGVPFTVTSSGGSITGLSVTIDGGPDFVLGPGGNQCGATLGADRTCVVEVVFKPSDGGPRTGRIVVDGAGHSATAALRGTGVAVANGGKLVLTPPTPAIAGVPIGGTGKVIMTLVNPTTTATGVITISSSHPELTVLAAENDCQGAAGGPGTSCNFTVTFSPTAARGVGTRGATLTVATVKRGSVSAPVTGAAVQPLSITPPGQEFMAIAATTGTSQTFTVHNSGGGFTGVVSGPLLAGTGPNPQVGWWTKVTDSCHGVTVPAVGMCTIVYRFSPPALAALGVATALLQVTDETTNIAATATVTGTVTTPAELAFTNLPPDTYDFGDVAAATASAPAAFALKNIGGATTGAISYSIAAPFVAEGAGATPCTSGVTTLAGGASCSLQVTFAPPDHGTGAPGVLAIDSAVAADGSAVKVSAVNGFLHFLGSGRPGYGDFGSLDITPTPTDVGAVPAGGMGMTRTLLFTNRSGSTATISSAPVSSDPTHLVVAPGDCIVGQVIDNGAACSFTVTFEPAAGKPPGIQNGIVTLVANDGSSVRAAGLIGRVTGNAVLALTTSPAGGGGFGNVLQGASSAARTWVVTNIGDLAAAALVLVNTSATHFSTAGSTCSGALAAGATCKVVVTATPREPATGALGATISLGGAAFDNAPLTVTDVSMNAVTPALLAPAQALVTFAATPLGSPSAAVTVTIRNTVLDTAQTSGPLVVSVSDLAYSFTGCGAARVSGLAASTACDLLVKFSPRSVAPLDGTLTVSGAPGGTVTVPLVARGVPSLTISPAPAAFTHDAIREFTIVLTPVDNPTSTGDLTVTLADTSQFRVMADDCSTRAELRPNPVDAMMSPVVNDTCKVSVKYTGTGTHSTTLAVAGASAANTAVAALEGR